MLEFVAAYSSVVFSSDASISAISRSNFIISSGFNFPISLDDASSDASSYSSVSLDAPRAKAC